MNPLPASEVRRRGTRMRRRNNALAAIGGVAAVAIIATPIAVAASHTRTDTTPPPTNPSPSVTWVTEIPADFPLTAGLPRATTDDGYQSLADPVCEGTGWSPDTSPAPVSVEQAVQTESEGGWDRTIALYADDESATSTWLSLQGHLQTCAAATEGAGEATEMVETTDDSFSYVDHLSDAGDAYVYRVVLVGNALLIDRSFSMGTGDPQVVQHAVDLIDTKSAPVVDAMESTFSGS